MSARLGELAVATDRGPAAAADTTSTTEPGVGYECMPIGELAAHRTPVAEVVTPALPGANSGAAAADEVLAQRQTAPLPRSAERSAQEPDALGPGELVTDADVEVPAQRERDIAGASREQRFAELYQTYWAHTVRFIEHRLRAADQGWAQDLAQTTFARAWPYVDRVEPADDGTLYRWLSTIARHAVCDHYSKGFGRQRAAEVPLPPDAPLWRSGAVLDDSAATDAVEQRTDLTAALEQLPTEIRQAVQQRVVEELPWAVVAQRMQHGKALVRRLVEEGLDSLRHQMGDHSGDVDAAPDPLQHARRAVAEVSRRRVAHQRRVGERARAEQLTRWHTEDHTTVDSTRGVGEVAR